MRVVRILAVILIILTLFCIQTQARVGFVLDKSLTVPKVTGVREAIFSDMYHDGRTEVLVRDSQHVILYSVEGDSLLFEVSVDSGFAFNSVDLGDANRDGVADILALSSNDKYGSYPDVKSWHLDMYDGAANYERRYRDIWTDTAMWLGGLVRTVDINSDGVNELLMSTNSVSFVADARYTAWNDRGYTYIYFSFPDSLVSRSPFVTVDVDRQAHSVDSQLLWISTQNNSYQHPGPGYLNSLNNALLRPDGSMIEVGNHSYGQQGCMEPYNTVQNTIGCVGHLMPYQLGLQVVRQYLRSFNCDNWPSDSVTVSLTLFQLVSPDSLTVLWTHDSTSTPRLSESPPSYDNFAFDPLLPGYFFAFLGDTLLMFRGSDGSTRDRLTQVPAGTRYWDYPYADSIPRLIVINGATVSIYHLDIATGVDDQNRNKSLPTEFTLSNPYPNPFNPSSSFTVGTGAGGLLDVAIFNTLGQRVTTLFAGKVTLNRNMSFHWEMTDKASGIYFVRAQLGDAALVRKMLFLK